MRTLLVVSVMLLTAGRLVAAPPDVRWDNDDVVTYVELARRYTAKTEQLKQFPVRIVSEGFQPLQKPSPTSKPSLAPALPFLAQVLILGSSIEDYKQFNGLYYLVASPGVGDENPTVLGWIPRDYVLTGKTCLKDKKSEIEIKAMVVNSLTYLKKGGDKEDVKLLPPKIRLAPRADGKDEGEFRFFDFYFVFADTKPEKEDEGFALLGEFPRLPLAQLSLEEFRQKAKIVGWVEKSRLCFWRTREAVQWNDTSERERKEKGNAYASKEQALWAAGVSQTKPDMTGPGSVVAEVFVDNKPVLWEPKRMRYPLLAIKHGDGDDVPYEGHGKNFLFRVGIVGDVYDDKGEMVMTEKMRQSITEEIRRTEQQLTRTEILFVIDRTDSMEEWWVATEKAVRRLLKQMKESGRPVSVGFCFFGDVNAGIKDKEGKATLEEAVKWGGVIPGRLLDPDLDKEELEKTLTYLADTTKKIPGGDRPEMVYAGLEIGLREAKWGGKDGARHARKMVVLIGDDGNHNLPPEEEKAVQDRIAALCVPSADDDADYKTPIEFYALHVCPVGDDEFHLKFKSQTEALIERIKKRSPGSARAAYYNAAKEETKFLAEIERRYVELTAHVAEKKAELDRIRRGQVASVTEIRDPEVLRMLQSIAAKRKIRVEDILKGAQAFDDRFIWSNSPKNGEKQIRQMILVSAGEVDQVLALLENYLYETDNPLKLEDLANRLIATQAGDGKEVSIEKVRSMKDQDKLRALNAIKVKHGFSFVDELSDYLGYNLPEGAKRPPPDEPRERLIKQKLQKKFYLLQDLRAEQVYNYTKKDGFDLVKLERSKGCETLMGDKRRGFQRGEEKELQGARWYWVDFEKEWP